ncbi:MAG: hypothetical protein AAF533_25695, partial [Acidobacteriota bacterium]
VKLEPRDYVAARWILSEFEEGELPEGIGWELARDREGRPVFLFKRAYWIDQLAEKHPELVLAETSGSVTT